MGGQRSVARSTVVEAVKETMWGGSPRRRCWQRNETAVREEKDENLDGDYGTSRRSKAFSLFSQHYPSPPKKDTTIIAILNGKMSVLLIRPGSHDSGLSGHILKPTRCESPHAALPKPRHPEQP
jgi:hypothetical protein